MIKDSGDRTEFETGAKRDMHAGKGRMDLLPWYGIMEVSKHCEEGAIKYGEQIIAYDAAGNRIWDGIWGWGSYGFEQGLIEAMGAQLLGHDDVEGWLTARQVTKMWRCRNAAKNR